MATLREELDELLGEGHEPVVDEATRGRLAELERTGVDHSGLLARMLEISESIPEEHLAEVPRDLSINLDHYLYGTPKQVEP